MFCVFFNKQTNKTATITTELLNKKLMRKNYKELKILNALAKRREQGKGSALTFAIKYYL